MNQFVLQYFSKINGKLYCKYNVYCKQGHIHPIHPSIHPSMEHLAHCKRQAEAEQRCCGRDKADQKDRRRWMFQIRHPIGIIAKTPTLTSVCDVADDRLFTYINDDSQHLLRSLLPATEMITIICANVGTAYNFLPRHQHSAITAS